EAALLGPGPEDLEDQLLLAQAGGVRDLELLGQVRELGHAHVLERGEVYDRRFRSAGPLAFGPLRPFGPLLLSALAFRLPLALVPILPVVMAGPAAAFGAVPPLGALASFRPRLLGSGRLLGS